MTLQLPAPPTRAELRHHLVTTAIAGKVATSRENNLEHYRLIARGARDHLFGLRPANAWTAAEVLALMVKKAGVDPSPGHVAGVDTIDPDLTIDALETMGARLGGAVTRREDVVLATGHPGALLPVYIEIARALDTRGCRVRTLAAGRSWIADTRDGPRQRGIRYICGVAALSSGGALNHTHSPRPMEEMLVGAEAVGERVPDLVVADHGWAGAAGQAGVDAVSFADCNDPALFVGEAEGRIQVAVPLDDNVDPRHYTPVTAYLLGLLDAAT